MPPTILAEPILLAETTIADEPKLKIATYQRKNESTHVILFLEQTKILKKSQQNN